MKQPLTNISMSSIRLHQLLKVSSPKRHCLHCSEKSLHLLCVQNIGSFPTKPHSKFCRRLPKTKSSLLYWQGNTVITACLLPLVVLPFIRWLPNIILVEQPTLSVVQQLS